MRDLLGEIFQVCGGLHSGNDLFELPPEILNRIEITTLTNPVQDWTLESLSQVVMEWAVWQGAPSCMNTSMLVILMLALRSAVFMHFIGSAR